VFWLKKFLILAIFIINNRVQQILNHHVQMTSTIMVLIKDVLTWYQFPT